MNRKKIWMNSGQARYLFMLFTFISILSGLHSAIISCCWQLFVLPEFSSYFQRLIKIIFGLIIYSRCIRKSVFGPTRYEVFIFRDRLKLSIAASIHLRGMLSSNSVIDPLTAIYRLNITGKCFEWQLKSNNICVVCWAKCRWYWNKTMRPLTVPHVRRTSQAIQEPVAIATEKINENNNNHNVT